jgi:hypothetical protein
LLARQHTAGAPQEDGQDVEFEAGHLQRRPVDLDGATRGIQSQAAVPVQHAGVAPDLLACPSAENRLDARHEFAHAERLAHVIVCAKLQADDAVGLLAAGGDHDDGQVAGGAKLAAHLEPVHLGQHHVQQNQIRLCLARKAQSLTPVGRHQNFEVGGAQVVSEQIRDRGFVIDDEDAGGHASMIASFCGRRVSEAGEDSWPGVPGTMRLQPCGLGVSL